jgi:lysylphosphatidylglycerol synthetase-like protein (DUF2156 family)
MVSLTFFFLFGVVLFAIIGGMRGWAKEVIVTFSVILAIFLVTVLERYVPIVRDSFAVPGSISQFWMRSILLVILAFFGYQTPNLPKLGGTRFARERLQDTLLGIFIGALNGFLIWGTLWYWMYEAGYPFDKYIIEPIPGTPAGDAAIQMLTYMPPAWLGIPIIYFAIGLAFIFVIVVFI